MFLPLFIYLIVLRTIINTILQRRNILITLLRLEATTLTLTITAIQYIGDSVQIEIFFFIIILTIGATEARIGLALLISISRKSGSDIIKSLTIRKC
jgi:NADH-ubiquinone oxidoreductase chain 4L